MSTNISDKTTTSNTVFHKADSRGIANLGWLNSRHSFSFANYYDPQRMSFGVLRVLNDDVVAGGRGFGKHPHDNMEIISIPLEGELEHKDSMGNVALIKKGDIQVLSAGTGITHSEYNRNKDQKVSFLQIWVLPNEKNVKPRYDQVSLEMKDRENKFQQILSPHANDEGVWIHQNAWFHLSKMEKGLSLEYDLKDPTNGVYAFILNGTFNIQGHTLNARDGLGVWNVQSLRIQSHSKDAEVLLMEVPMQVNG